ncbi:glycoside hydrolase family 25 protein [Lewinella sp. W8]|uniref:glycoside hydrolase family 25 protein n=1 Tax=Lewinella sp. W8 TaxID=2528208 RepID=UPI0020A6209C|nr:GH25 family lysozyme [Lewinella sp. W8]
MRAPFHILLLLMVLCVTTACGPDFRDPGEVFEVRGVDVSHYQGVIDWEALAKDNHHFSFIKATEGRELRDKAFAANWSSAGQWGFCRGAYHFFRPEVPASIQARHFFDVVELEVGDLPPVLDVEERGRLSPADLVTSVKQWLKMAELHYGVKPILYTGQNFYNRYLAGQFDEYPLWIARYDAEEPVTVCGRDYQFWQYTDEGQLPGVVGDVDRNVFYGTRIDLALLCIPPRSANPVDDLAKFGE